MEPSDSQALLVLVYDELRSLARARLSHVPPGNTLQPTALVHEAYARLVRGEEKSWNGKAHFFGAAAEAMRQILVEQARRKSRIKHGGEQQRVELSEDGLAFEIGVPPDDLLAIHDMLWQLEQADPELALIVKLRFFAGLAPEEIANLLKLSRRTVERRWRYASALLRRQLDPSEERADASRS